MCIQTNPELAALLARVRDLPPMTPEQIRAQRRSFVRGQIGFGDDKDEAAYREALVCGDTVGLAQMDAEAAERMKRADLLMDMMGF